jgi:hypothetical protein
MADLNLRNVDSAFVAKLKADAATAGLTLRDHCILLLSAKYEPNAPRPGLVPTKAITKAIQPPPSKPADDRYRRPDHDHATCRVYKCGICASK